MKHILAYLFLIAFFSLQKVSWTQSADTYNERWRTIDSLKSKQLTRSALDETNKLFEFVKNKKNSEQIIKCLIYKIGFETYLHEDAFTNSFQYLMLEINLSKEPQKQWLHSMTAEILSNYYTYNYWTYNNRTFLPNKDSLKPLTWSHEKILQEITYHIKQSLQNPKLLFTLPSNYFPEIIEPGKDSKILKPTLLDLLSTRALHILNTINYEPIEDIDFFSEAYFDISAKFIYIKPETEDSLSANYLSLLIYQQLTSFHVEKALENHMYENPLVQYTLERLQWIYEKSNLENKDGLYLTSLQKLYQQTSHLPLQAWVGYQLSQHYQTLGNQYHFNDSTTHLYKNLLTEAHDICQNVLEKWPNEYGAEQCKQLYQEMTTQNINIQVEKVVSPNAHSLGLVTYKNTPKLYFKLIPLNYKEYKEIKQKNNSENIIQVLNHKKADKTWQINTLVFKDFQPHTLEFSIPPILEGFYVLVCSNDSSFNYSKATLTYSEFWASNLSSNERSLKNKGTIIQVLHREKGIPLEHVEIILYSKDYNYKINSYEEKVIGKFTTNSKGEILIPEQNKGYRNYFYELIYKNEYLPVENLYSLYSSSLPSQQIRTHLFTDRIIYRPGQAVLFKGIVVEKLGEEFTIPSEYATTISLYDVNSQKIESIEVAVNEFGSFKGEFILPMGLLNGKMYLKDEKNKTTYYFSVEEYKRPTFEMSFYPLLNHYKLHDTIIQQGQIKNFSGATLNNVEVKYTVSRSEYNPYVRYSKYETPSSNVQNKTITQGKTKTNDLGEFSISFHAKAPSTPKHENSFYIYHISVEATDINGETQKNSTYIYLGYQAYTLFAQIEDFVCQEKIHVAQIQALNLQGVKQIANVDVNVFSLNPLEQVYIKRYWDKPEFTSISDADWNRNFFHYESPKKNNPENERKNRIVWKKNINTATDSVLDLSFTRLLPSGEYLLQLESKDASGVIVRYSKKFTVFSEKDKKTPTEDVVWTYLYDKKYEPQETAKIFVGTKEKELTLFGYLEKNGEILYETLLPLKNEMKFIEIPMLESYRGNVFFHIYTCKNNRWYKKIIPIRIPYSNKELSIKTQRFRTTLLPGTQEEWSFLIQGSKSEKKVSELMLAMYDASLDQLSPYNWNFNIYTNRISQTQHIAKGFQSIPSVNYIKPSLYIPKNISTLEFDKLHWFDLDFYALTSSYRGGNGIYPTKMLSLKNDKSMLAVETLASEQEFDQMVMESSPEETMDSDFIHQNPPVIRKNLQETAFFFPQLKTNEYGDVQISFTVPESLTRWKLLGLAHTQELEYGLFEKEVITQKNIMVMPNHPRFITQNDRIILSSKIINNTDTTLEIEAFLEFFNPITHKPLQGFKHKQKTISLSPKQSKFVEWEIHVPDSLSLLGYRIIAQSTHYSDGEEKIVPVLSNRKLVIESLPFTLRANEKKQYTFASFKNNQSNTLKNESYTVELTSNPIWYVVQSIPYMAELPYESAEQLFTRYYSNMLAYHIIHANPEIKNVLNAWSHNHQSAFTSNLEKNKDLKYILLEQTPWVLNAKDESSQKKNLALFFQENLISQQQKINLQKLKECQQYNGGWSWFKGMPENKYITMHIISGLGHLKKLGILNQPQIETTQMIEKALQFLDRELEKEYDWILKNVDKKHEYQPSEDVIRYFYARSFFLEDIPISENSKQAYDYFLKQMKKKWTKYPLHQKGLIALVFYRNHDILLAKGIVKSLLENTIQSQELGMYWKNLSGGLYTNESSIETHALLMEAFKEIDPNPKIQNELKIWLIKNKQTSHWGTSKATAKACYVLLMDQQTTWQVSASNIWVNHKKINDTQHITPEAGTGYFQKTWYSDDVKKSLSEIEVENSQREIVWGAAFWKYIENSDKVAQSPTTASLRIEKKVYIKKQTNSGTTLIEIGHDNIPKVGDKITIRLEVFCDKNYEFVHIQDNRAAGLEPLQQLSGFQWGEGIGYYQSTQDASTHFFIDHLIKGTYIFEYDTWASHSGNFNLGISSIQCLYAPEFSAHSSGNKIQIHAIE